MAYSQKSVFVTVGTTLFNALIQKISQPSVLHTLKNKGYTKVTLQIGNGDYVPAVDVITGVKLDFYRFKKSLSDDMDNADLVISHAGAGTCLEVLEKGKPLIVVVNEELMDNHQTELANALHSRGHLIATTVINLQHTISEFDPDQLVAFPNVNQQTFLNYLNNLMEN